MTSILKYGILTIMISISLGNKMILLIDAAIFVIILLLALSFKNPVKVEKYSFYAGNIGVGESIPVPTPTPTPPPPDTTPPAVTIIQPQNGGVVPRNSTVTITATSSDDSGVQKVEFRVNNVLKCTDTLTPYSCNWNVPAQKNRPYTIEAKSYDNAGNTATHTISVTSSN